jgi:hypothetical protein
VLALVLLVACCHHFGNQGLASISAGSQKFLPTRHVFANLTGQSWYLRFVLTVRGSRSSGGAGSLKLVIQWDEHWTLTGAVTVEGGQALGSALGVVLLTACLCGFGVDFVHAHSTPEVVCVAEDGFVVWIPGLACFRFLLFASQALRCHTLLKFFPFQ